MTGVACSDLVMVVEDDQDVRQAISEVLEDNAYRSLTASNGQEAMDELRSGAQRPCLILLDIMMPIMDGWQFRSLQQQDPQLSDIPIVVLTAHADIQEAGRRMQAAACLKKPVQLASLLATVDQICRKG